MPSPLRSNDASDLLWSLLEESTDGVWEWEIEPDEVRWSPSLYHLLQHPEGPRSVGDIRELAHPADRARLEAAIQDHLDGGGIYSVDVRFRRGSGGYVWTTARGTSIRNADGSPRVMYGFLLDISERREAAAGLQRSLDRFRSFFDHCPAAVFIKDPDLTYRYVNKPAAELAGTTVEIMTANRDTEIFPPETAAELNRIDRAVLEEHRTLTWTGDVERADGSIRWVQDTKFPVILPDGRTAVGGFGVDLTELRDAHTVVESRQRLESLGRLSGGVAHEFNNMLTVILGNVRAALDRIGDDGPADLLREVETAAERSARIAGQLLSFARQAPSRGEVIDPGDAAVDLGSMLRHLLGEEVELRIETGPDLWPIAMDRAQFDQLVTNLCMNARDAIEGHGHIDLSVANVSVDTDRADQGPVDPGEFVEIRVRDDGVGMDDHTLSQIFEPFYTTKPAGEGTGLGLSTVYGIVKRAGGWIDVHSEAGVGSEFCAFLPRTDQAAADAGDPSPSDAAHESRRLAGATILVVEDETSILSLLERVLTQAGVHVLAAESPEKALELAADPNLTIDLLVSDVVMPKMTGPELALRLRGDRPELRTIFMSGYSPDHIADPRLSDRPDEFMAKPFTMDEFRTRVARALA